MISRGGGGCAATAGVGRSDGVEISVDVGGTADDDCEISVPPVGVGGSVEEEVGSAT